MIANIVVEGRQLGESGILTLQIDRQLVVNVSALEAQKKVNRFVHWEISSQMHAEAPVLVVGDVIFWQIPIHLTFPAFGDIGCVGSITVDPVTGEMDVSRQVIQLITEKAEQLALRFTPPAAKSS